MTEAEWLACTDPAPMLEFLRYKGSDRKLRLYLCGECRLMWHLMYHDSSRKAVEAAERFADGDASEEELGGIAWLAECPTFGNDFDGTWRRFCVPGEVPDGVLRLIELDVLDPESFMPVDTPEASELLDQVQFAANLAEKTARTGNQGLSWLLGPYSRNPDLAGGRLLRDIFGNPFRPVAVDPAWLTSTVVALARGIYEERAFDRLPILADALQDAGCDNDEVLNHCRGPGTHVRGCWVIDLVLGKE